MNRSNANARLVCTFSDPFLTMVPTWSMSFSYLDVDGLPKCASLSAVVPPSLKWLYHLCGAHCFVPESLFNLAEYFHLRIAKLDTRLNTIALFKFYCYFAKNENAMMLTDMTSSISSLLAMNSCKQEKFKHAH